MNTRPAPSHISWGGDDNYGEAGRKGRVMEKKEGEGALRRGEGERAGRRGEGEMQESHATRVTFGPTHR